MKSINRKQERLVFFNDCLQRYSSDFLDDFLNNYSSTPGLSVILPDLDFPALLNDHYWNLIENHVKESLIDKKEELSDEADDRVDVYKILSTIEFSILSIKPYVLLKDNSLIDYSDSSQFQLDHIETLVNSHFALYSAFWFISRWSGTYKEVFSNLDIISAINRKETIGKREFSMTMLEEHITVSAYAAKSPIIPILSNACWWRAVCAFASELQKERK